MADQSAHFDLVIAGGGIVGGALAASLAKLPLKIALVDHLPLSSLKSEQQAEDAVEHKRCATNPSDFGARVSALTPRSMEFLRTIGCWRDMDSKHYLPYQTMTVWDELGTGEISFKASDVHSDELGCIVENSRTLNLIYQSLVEQQNLSLLLETSVSAVNTDTDHGSGGYRLSLSDDRAITGGLLVIADGANSRLRAKMGYEMREWDYNHTAIVATVQTSQSHQNTAWQRFSENGPLALLPLQDQEESARFCSIVWSQKSQEAARLMELDDASFALELERHSEGRLGEIEAVSKRISFPLKQRHAKTYMKGHSVVIGDAAHSIHPLAGQGVNLGLKDVQALSEVIHKAYLEKVSIAHPSVLRRYQRNRQADNLLMMGVMEGFKRLFETENPAVRMLRNTGMQWLNAAHPLKKQIIKQAMGL